MLEIEVDHCLLDRSEVPDDIVRHFNGSCKSLTAVTLFPWEEHCTECAMPLCYTTCDLYESRKDGKCRRFVNGIVIIPGFENIQGYIARVSFKRWGQMLAYANKHMISVNQARRLENFFYHGASLVSRIPDHGISVLGRKSVSARMMRRMKQAVARNGIFADKALQPDYFLAEIFNPDTATVGLSLTISSRDESTYHPGFQALLELAPGFNRFTVPVEDIQSQVDLEDRFSVTLNPNILNKEDEGLELYFGVLGFVCDSAAGEVASPCGTKFERPQVKVVAWDLDNTLWNGILIEDGLANLQIREDAVETVKQFDKRGILNTIVSKNNHDDAAAALEYFGIGKYFLHPNIGWGRKGVYISDIPRQFNVGADTVAFIDDSPFERDEAMSLNSQLRVYDATDCAHLLQSPEFNPPRTAESGKRREYYQTQALRANSRDSFGGDYLSFLRDCRIVLSLYSPTAENLDRIQELVQRTNQLNFSGNRYQREQIMEILADSRYVAYCMDCEDRYGQYGTIGFAVIDVQRNKLMDMMLSCRVQAKRVEHAFVSFLLRRSRIEGHERFLAQYNMTDRNRKAGAVFEDLGFKTTQEDQSSGEYAFDLKQDIPDDEVIEIRFEGEACPF
ncbi:MAG TPA: HAD-IIIC family phosphatase [Gammaproteobacteria bacterium]|nr:HAD-IIIC family phosphatase [Gammaproteobacteria bacterium]